MCVQYSSGKSVGAFRLSYMKFLQDHEVPTVHIPAWTLFWFDVRSLQVPTQTPARL